MGCVSVCVSQHVHTRTGLGAAVLEGGPRVCWCHSRLLITKNDVSSQWKQNPALQSRPLPSPPLFLFPCTLPDSPSSSSIPSSMFSFWIFFFAAKNKFRKNKEILIFINDNHKVHYNTI